MSNCDAELSRQRWSGFVACCVSLLSARPLVYNLVRGVCCCRSLFGFFSTRSALNITTTYYYHGAGARFTLPQVQPHLLSCLVVASMKRLSPAVMAFFDLRGCARIPQELGIRIAWAIEINALMKTWAMPRTSYRCAKSILGTVIAGRERVLGETCGYVLGLNSESPSCLL